MPAAFSPNTPEVDQSVGSDPSHTAKGSRFNDPGSRLGLGPGGATVTEAIAEFKKGTFTAEDLKQVAFAMGYQIIEGKDAATLAAKLTNLEKELGEANNRAVQAEAAFVSAKQELDAAKAAKQ